MNEFWKDIKGYEGLYQVSNLGMVKSLWYSKEKILKPASRVNGYLFVGLYKNNKCSRRLIHRLVIETFIQDKNNFKSMPDEDRSKINLAELEVNHIDENKQNNNVSNLEWCTHLYNMRYGSGRQRTTINRRKKVNQYDLKGNFIKTWNSIKDAEKELNLGHHISECCKGKCKTIGGFKWEYDK